MCIAGVVAALAGTLAAVAAWIDLRTSRLPNRLTVPAAVAAFLAAIAAGRPWLIVGGLAWAALYAVAHVVSSRRGGGLGAGDVKFALSVGVAAALGGPFGVVAAIGCANLATLGVAWFTRRRRVPHGPLMLAGAVLAGALGDPVFLFKCVT